jgi:NADPH-dependent 2,4-dienoyl-CoA reductase/sulfur reductase-like enzyme/nitrite reductase/ring-hydroxylating ferredoxin subunit
MSSAAPLSGPDLLAGIADGDLREGVPLLGHAHGEAIVLVRDQGRVHAVGATCTHYGGPLAEGLVTRGAIHCPWHHACFDLASGTPRGPAITPLACWDVEVAGGKIRVGARKELEHLTVPAGAPASVVIIGGGAAGIACAEMLRHDGYAGRITIVSAEGSDPVDRPNLSKDYLAGNAPEEWVYLRTHDALGAIGVDFVPGEAATIDREARTVTLSTGRTIGWGVLVLATGAEPIRLPIAGAELPHVHVLRTLSDSKAIAAAGASGKRAVVIGASFIGLEAAASLRTRGCEVTIVAPETVPLARVLGDQVGAFVRGIHEAHGETFRLGKKPVTITAESVTLDDGEVVPADVVVMGVGVRPRLGLAERAGLTVDRGVVVDGELRAAPGIWAAGDIARFPLGPLAKLGDEPVRIEHWQVAVRHGQIAARSILGNSARPTVPFFWSAHHDVTIGYVGHAEAFDTPEVHGDLEARDAHVVYRSGGRVRAVATINRDRLGLEVEAAMARRDDAALAKLVS